MGAVVLAIHIMVCLTMVVVVLLQRGKGADIGAVFGGSSQTVFGSSGAGNFLTRLTGGLAVVFFATSLYLAYNSTRHVSSTIFSNFTVKTLPAKPAPGEAKPKGALPKAPIPGATK